MQVPLLDLKRQYARIADEVDEAMREVVASQYFVLGPEVEALESEIADYTGASFAIGCASGSDALLLALMVEGIGPGDAVLCPAYTFFATAGSIWRLGARPVFADIDPSSFNLDLRSARREIEAHGPVKAIIPVHLYGQAATRDVHALAEQLAVPVIEDAAQAIGARDEKGERIGSTGTQTCFSFFPTKNLGGFGDGGLVTTDDAERAEQLRRLRVHGGHTKYHHAVVGLNSRLDALQAAVLRVKLRHLETWHGERARNARRYDEAFHALGAQTGEVPLAEGGLPLRTPTPASEPARHVYNQYVIRVPAEHRDALRAHCQEQGIGTEVYYPIPLHRQECFASLGYAEGALPVSEALARESIALPIFSELEEHEQQYVVETIGSYLRR